MSKSILKRELNPIQDFIRERLVRENVLDKYNERPAYQRSQYIDWITSAKRETTKENRLNQMIDELKAGDSFKGEKYNAKKKKDIKTEIKDKELNMKVYEFKAEIKKVEGINGAYIEIPFDVKKEFGKGRVPVRATFDGILYEGSLVKMKTPCHIIGIQKKIREELGKEAGDIISVTIQEREK